MFQEHLIIFELESQSSSMNCESAAFLRVENTMEQLDKPAESPFVFAECFILPLPIGRTAQNLRELLEGLRDVDESVLHYHLWQSRMAVSHPTVEYPNDFAFWAETVLQDSRPAEKLSSLDPFDYKNSEQVRDRDYIDRTLAELRRRDPASSQYVFPFPRGTACGQLILPDRSDAACMSVSQ